MSSHSNPKEHSSGAPIWARVERLSRLAWRMAILSVLSQVILVTVVLGLLLCLMDAQFRWSELGMRVLAWIVLLIGVLSILWHAIKAIRMGRGTNIETATQVENSLGLGIGWLTSAVAFRESTADDPRLGSLELRRLAMARAETLLRQEPLEETLNSRIPLCWILGTCLLLSCVGVIYLTFPRSSQIAAQRLLWPWSTSTWPQSVELEFLDLPKVVSVGSDLEIALINRRGKIPADLELHFKSLSNESVIEKMTPQNFGDAGYHRLINLQDSFLVRGIGGDDRQNSWFKVDVTRPSKLDTFVFEIKPPDYTNIAPTELVGSAINVLDGTRLKMRGRFDQPVREISLSSIVWDDNNRATDQEWSLLLNDDHKNFVLEGREAQALVLRRSVRFAIRWISMSGLSSESDPGFDIHVTKDQPPEVVLVEPTIPISITPDGKIEMIARASDDLNIEYLTLHWQRMQDAQNDSGGEISFLSSGLPDRQNTGSMTLERGNRSTGSQWTVTGFWQPSQSVTLAPDESISIWFEARDSLHQIGRSATRTIRIENASELTRQIADQQNNLKRALQNALKNQSQSLATITQLSEVLERLKKVDRADTASFSRALEQQESTSLWLAGAADSALHILDEQAARLDQNQLSSSNLASKVQSLRHQIQGLVEEKISPAIKRIEKIIQFTMSDTMVQSKEGQLTLNQTIEIQSAVERELKSMLRELGEQQSIREFHQQIQQFSTQQQELAKRTADLAHQVLQLPSSSQVTSEGTRIAATENDLARRLDQMASELTQASADNLQPLGQSSSPMETLRDQVSSLGASGLMRQASELLSSNRIDQSANLQSEIAKKLSDLADREDRTGQMGSDAPEQDSRDSLRRLHLLLRRLIQQQHSIVLATKNLADRSSSLTTDEAIQFEASRIAETQSTIRKSLEQSLVSLDSLKIFKWAANLAIDDMNRAAAAIQRLQLANPGLEAAVSAEERLQQIFDAIESGSENHSTKGDASKANNDQSQQKSANTLQSLMLLRKIQESINDQVEALRQSSENDQLSASQWIRSTQLANEQKQIADHLRDLTESMK